MTLADTVSVGISAFNGESRMTRVAHPTVVRQVHVVSSKLSL